MAVSIVGSDLDGVVVHRTGLLFGLHGGGGDVVRLRETIRAYYVREGACGDVRVIKADSHRTFTHM